MNKNDKIIISIEGNIGSGKSTLVKILKERYTDEILFVDEPVNDWKNIKMNKKNLIEHFYSDQKKYGYLFQSIAFITRLKKIKNAIDNPKYKIIITERSMESDKFLFAKMLYEQKTLNELQWNAYNYWFDFFNIKMNYFIYVRTDVDKCVERIKIRSRSGEENIPLDYLNDLHNNHDNWLLKKKNTIIIDGNMNIFNEDIRKKQCDIIYKYINNSLI